MLKKSVYVLCLMAACNSLLAQREVFELTFTAKNINSWIEMDRIRIKNRSQSCDTVIYYPDTVLVLDYQVGNSEVGFILDQFKVYQNYPNPVLERTLIDIFIPARDDVLITISDLTGRTIIVSNDILDKGYHQYIFIPGIQGVLIFSVTWRERTIPIKINGQISSLHQNTDLRHVKYKSDMSELKVGNAKSNFSYNFGDTLLYICYADNLESGIIDNPDTSMNYSFQFASNIPCPEDSIVSYAGQTYNTVQIFSQCWLADNLNIGTMIMGTQNMGNNGIIEKYCYDDDTNNCLVYGGLYQWDEMMNYQRLASTQGICPPGWHIPSDEEWKILEGAADSYYGIGDSEWDQEWAYRGSDAGNNLKSTTGWHENIGTDLYGFTILPSGNRYIDGEFYVLEYSGFFWTSVEYKLNTFQAWNRGFGYANGQINRKYNNPKSQGLSVRCLKDNY